MKKFIAAIFLLICGLVVLLATIDLEPYLTADKTATLFTDSTVKEQIAPQAKIFEETVPTNVTASTGPAKYDKPPSVVEIYPEQEQVVMPPRAEMIPIEKEAKMEQKLSPLVELEVTILPVGDYPFSILLDTYLEQEAAQQAMSIYQKRGISAHWVKVGLGEMGIRYRLFTGAFSTKSEAQQYLHQNKLVDKLIKPTIYSARIGVYTDKAQLASAFIKAGETGVIPYILGTKKGDYYLYVGAFYTFIGATNKCHYLAEAGLSCEPVKRSTIPPE